jgi:hypothetical protein
LLTFLKFLFPLPNLWIQKALGNGAVLYCSSFVSKVVFSLFGSFSFALSLISNWFPLFFPIASGSSCRQLFRIFIFSFKNVEKICSPQQIFRFFLEILIRCFVIPSLSFSPAIPSCSLLSFMFLQIHSTISIVFSFSFSKKM